MARSPKGSLLVVLGMRLTISLRALTASAKKEDSSPCSSSIKALSWTLREMEQGG